MLPYRLLDAPFLNMPRSGRQCRLGPGFEPLVLGSGPVDVAREEEPPPLSITSNF